LAALFNHLVLCVKPIAGQLRLGYNLIYICLMSFITIVPVFRCLGTNRTCTNHCRLKIFVPITVLAFIVLVPVNWTNDTLESMTVVHSDIDKLSISNIPTGSKR
jgi:hypothetical protein